MTLRRWDTLISDCKNLDFRELFDNGRARFVVEASEGEIFEVFLGGGTGPYVIVEEEHLTKYWSQKAKLGWTFIVEQSDLPNYFPHVMNPEDYTHYVVSTSSICLEVLSKESPIIKRIV